MQHNHERSGSIARSIAGLRRRFTTMMTHGATLSVLSLTGCQAAYFLTADETREVKAEYARIGTNKVAVVVWADRYTLDVDPKARHRIGEAVTYELKRHLPKAQFVPAREVTELQTSGLDWQSMTNQQLAERLGCDLILRIDLLEYTTRAADTRELRKGRVEASINLYEGGEGARIDPIYTADVTATYPPPGKHAIADVTDYDLLRASIEQFAQETAKKFYDHRESRRGPESK